ncbi:hypothetical protein LX36DRAFT_436901 [Colletotrichum falcatum]|nr:hypothetical protein LX36DRAFT_436901 [Colletotrichum falcatum]
MNSHARHWPFTLLPGLFLSCPSRRQRSGQWAVHHDPGPFSQPKQPSPSIGCQWRTTRLRARKHGTPHSLLALVFVHRPGPNHRGVIPGGALEFPCHVKVDRDANLLYWPETTGWLGNILVPGKARGEKKGDKMVFGGRKGRSKGLIGLALALVSLQMTPTKTCNVPPPSQRKLQQRFEPWDAHVVFCPIHYTPRSATQRYAALRSTCHHERVCIGSLDNSLVSLAR